MLDDDKASLCDVEDGCDSPKPEMLSPGPQGDHINMYLSN